MTDPSTKPVLTPVGVAKTPYKTLDDAPHQGFVDDEEATVEVFEAYADALSGIDDVVRVTVVYWAGRSDRDSLTDESDIGVFTKRTPNRPNPLNICTCTLLEREGRRLRVRGLDAVDGSLIVDLKPALQAER